MLGNPTLLDLKTALRARGYAADTDLAQTEFVNTAYRRVLNEHRWPFLDKSVTLAATPGNASVTLSTTDLLHVDSVRLTEQSGRLLHEMEYIPYQDVKHRQFLDITTSNDQPYYWSQYAGTVVLYPTPDIAYAVVVEYRSHPAKLTADADTLVIPYAWQDAVLEAAMSEIATRQRDWPTVNQAEARYDAIIKTMKADYSIEQRQTGREVGHWDYWDQVER